MSKFHRTNFTRASGAALYFVAALTLSAAPAWANGLSARVYTAASIAPALEEIATAFRARAAGVVIVVAGASSALARQIENGAPANLYISANRGWIDYLAERRLLREDSRKAIAANTLVLVAPAKRPITLTIEPGMALAGALQNRPLAICDPDHVPCGIYARDALMSLDVWEKLSRQTIRAPNARAALAWVARGEAGAGIVYGSDAASESKVAIVGQFPAGSHDAIIYEVAKVKGHQALTAFAFHTFLSSPTAQKILLSHGFALPPR